MILPKALAGPVRSAFAFACLVFSAGITGSLNAREVAGTANPVVRANLPVVYDIMGGGAMELGQPVELLAVVWLDAGQIYQWRKDGKVIEGATEARYTIAAVAPADAGTYSITVTNVEGSTIASTALTVKPAAAPYALTAPWDFTVEVGQPVTLSYRAGGSYPRTYQWLKDDVAIPGATGELHRLPAVSFPDAGAYSLTVTNSYGTATIKVGSLTVTALRPPVIPAAQPGDVTIKAGYNVTFYVHNVDGSRPFSYQWSKDGVAIPGATTDQLWLVGVTLTDAGRYVVVVTNAAGSATSRSATLTVQPPIPVTFVTQPQAKTVIQGQDTYLYVEATGDLPISYQWSKDGVPIVGADSRYYNLTAAALADAGTYTVAASNAAGTVVSAPAILTVTPAVPPAIVTQPKSQVVRYDGSILLSVLATGTSPVRYQWMKNGVSVGDRGWENSFNLYGVTPLDSGSYTVVISNAAGAVTSEKATVTVEPAALPVITTQPASLQVAPGLSANFFPTISSVATGALTYQWRKNGVPIAGATSSFLNKAVIDPSDAGDYTLVITGVAGSVTSSIARLIVLPPAPPTIQSWPSSDFQFTPGYGLVVSTDSAARGSPPLRYQWFKQGVAIPGATSAALRFDYASAADGGVYTLTISNEAGVISSPPIWVHPSDSGSRVTPPWLDVARAGDIVYFLVASPARLERYDLARETWLPTVSLSRTPTAFVPATDGLYIAYGASLVRRSLDLSTETPVATASADVGMMFTLDDWVYTSAFSRAGRLLSGYGILRRSTLQAEPDGSHNFIFDKVATAPGLHRVFSAYYAAASGGPSSYGVNEKGRLDSVSSYSNYAAFQIGPRLITFPDDQWIAASGGAVYRTLDSTFVRCFGTPFNDLAFFADGTPVVLREGALTTVEPGSLLETGRVNVGADKTRLFARGSNAFVFGPAGTAGPFAVAKVAKSAITRAAGAALAAPTGRYSVDDAFVGPDGIVYLFSRSLQGLVRWSTVTRSYLDVVPLRAAPWFVSAQPGGPRMLAAYPDGEVTALTFQATPPPEVQVGALSTVPIAMLDLDGRILAEVKRAYGFAGEVLRIVLGPAGTADSVSGPAPSYGAAVAWQPALRRVYASGSTAGTQYTPVSTGWTFPTEVDLAQRNVDARLPIRLDPAGKLIVSSNGRVFDADLAPVGALANDVTDAAWLTAGLYTMRSSGGETEIQQWSRSNYLLARSVVLSGEPLRLFRLSDSQLVAVSMDAGVPAITVLNADLTAAASSNPQISFLVQPQSQRAAPDSSVSFSLQKTGGSGGTQYAWARDGVAIEGAGRSLLVFPRVQPADAGIYTAAASDSRVARTTVPAILGLSTTEKAVGSGVEIGTNILHPNGKIFDQVQLTGVAACIRADAGQATRVSFVDLNNDIVQLEFSGAGTLSLVLSGSSGPAAPTNYSQPDVRYMKGHAGIVITGANETTNVSVFSVGRATANDPTGKFNLMQPISASNDPATNGSPLFQGKEATVYDGIADVAYIAILSVDGKFGGLRAANARFFASKGLTGVYAPGVQFTGPVYVGDINAYDDATGVIMLGSVADARITGGDLAQANARAVQVSGLSRLKFTAGTDSHGRLETAQRCRASLEQNGIDITRQVVEDPGP